MAGGDSLEDIGWGLMKQMQSKGLDLDQNGEQSISRAWFFGMLVLFFGRDAELLDKVVQDTLQLFKHRLLDIDRSQSALQSLLHVVSLVLCQKAEDCLMCIQNSEKQRYREMDDIVRPLSINSRRTCS